MRRQPYLEYLEVMKVELEEMVAELENLGFHHGPEGSKETMHYDRVVRMRERVDHQTASTPRIEEAVYPSNSPGTDAMDEREAENP